MVIWFANVDLYMYLRAASSPGGGVVAILALGLFHYPNCIIDCFIRQIRIRRMP